MTTETILRFDRDEAKIRAAYANVTLEQLLNELDDDMRIYRTVEKAFDARIPQSSATLKSVSDLAAFRDETLRLYRGFGPETITKIDNALVKLHPNK